MYKLKKLKDEVTDPQGSREEAGSTNAENAQRQNPEREIRDSREASKAEGPIEGEGQVVTETKQLMMLKQAISFIDYSVGD